MPTFSGTANLTFLNQVQQPTKGKYHDPADAITTLNKDKLKWTFS